MWGRFRRGSLYLLFFVGGVTKLGRFEVEFHYVGPFGAFYLGINGTQCCALVMQRCRLRARRGERAQRHVD